MVLINDDLFLRYLKFMLKSLVYEIENFIKSGLCGINLAAERLNYIYLFIFRIFQLIEPS